MGNGPKQKIQLFEIFSLTEHFHTYFHLSTIHKPTGPLEIFVLTEQMRLAQPERRPLKQAATEYMGTYRFTRHAMTGLSAV